MLPMLLQSIIGLLQKKNNPSNVVTATSTGAGVIDPILFSSLVHKQYSARVVASGQHCHSSYGYLENAGKILWYYGDQPPYACQNISAIIANPNGNNPLENGFVYDNVVESENPTTESSFTSVVSPVENTNTTSNTGTLTSVFPNPANNEITIKGDYNSFKVIDLQGKEITMGTLNNKQAVVNTSNLPNGSYIIQLQGENTQFVRKIQIVH